MPKIKIFLLILLSTLVAYAGSLKFGFSQDDWYFLYISVANNLPEVLNFFNPWAQSGFAFYRPLGTQLYYFVSRELMGLSTAPLGMHIFMLIIHSLVGYNVYRLVSRMTKDTRLAVMTGVVYATSAVHFLSLYYIAATQQLLAALFSLLAVCDYLDRKRSRSAFFFLLALLSKEVAVVAPVVMVLAQIKIDGKINIKKIFKSIWPVALVGGLYIAMRLMGGLTAQSEYQLVLNGSVLSTLRWYYLFGYGAPEELVRYGLPRMGMNILGFIKDYAWQGIVTAVGPILLGIYALMRLKGRLIYLLWWALALTPVLFLQDHRYPHYLDLALIPLILLALEKLPKYKQLILAGVMIGVSLVSINLSERVHWTTKRSLQAESDAKLIECNDKVGVHFTGDIQTMRELSYTFSLENGPRVICDNPTLPVYYQGIYP